MAGSLNKVQLIGRLGADPEIKQMVNGKSVARLSVATSQSWKDKSSGERKEKTEWHRIVFFGRSAEVIDQYLKKGQQLYIEGRLQTSKYEKDGVERFSTDIIGESFNFISGGSGSSSPSSSSSRFDNDMNQDRSSSNNQEKKKTDEFEDDIPF